jgi:hypothetical protein
VLLRSVEERRKMTVYSILRKKITIFLVAAVLVVGALFGLGGLAITSRLAHAATATVDLGTAAPFAILAGTPNITNTGASVIAGNVGLSPATGAGIGLTCAQVNGTIYAVDSFGPAPCAVEDAGLLTIAKQDVTDAFIDAAGRTPVTTVATELGGTTKTAGVYDSGSTTFEITAGAGPLILDGQNDPSSVFIFEMGFAGTGLTVGPGSVISLINGAQACNVFWRVDTATIDTTAIFKGTILALNSITVANGANIEGRLLARNGSVTLINNTVTVPTCMAGSSGGSGSGSSGGSSSSGVPGFPNAGINPEDRNNVWLAIAVPAGLLVTLFSFYLIRKKLITWSKY